MGGEFLEPTVGGEVEHQTQSRAAPIESAAARRWRERSLWMASLEEPLTQRAGLPGDLDCDVVIVGAGFTGLWSAYYLKRQQPDLRIAIVEREIAGFGPSGRNGGWVSSGVGGSPRAFGLTPGTDALLRAECETHAGVDEVGAVARRERIECGFRKQGMLTIATTAPQQRRLRATIDRFRTMGLGSDDHRALTADQLEEHLHLSEPGEGLFSPHGAAVDPARLVRGLARACEGLGVSIFEGTEALELGQRRVRCQAGTIRAETVVRATEAYTITLPGNARRFLPLYSLMIATEPLPDDVWRTLGWRDGLCVRDLRHLFFYAQRTTDGRIAIGGRGAPYAVTSPIDERHERSTGVFNRLRDTLAKTFPAAAEANITHHWGGALAVPRDWSMSVSYDRTTGLASAGGYVGHGVVASNISGRTLADLILGHDSDLTSMPWVNHRCRNWEPEPARYLASQAIIRTLERADRLEDANGKTSRRERLVRPFMPPR